jgi:lipopolysaccharide export LptBFGC system permease protein LptF
VPFELLKSIGKTAKSSVPVLSAGLLYFVLSTLLAALGFSHFWPIAWVVWCAHAGLVHGVVRRLYFASRES